MWVYLNFVYMEHFLYLSDLFKCPFFSFYQNIQPSVGSAVAETTTGTGRGEGPGSGTRRIPRMTRTEAYFMYCAVINILLSILFIIQVYVMFI